MMNVNCQLSNLNSEKVGKQRTNNLTNNFLYPNTFIYTCAMTPEKEENISKTLREQEARAKLRESFLRAVNELNGRPCSVLTYEKTSLNASFAGWTPDGSEILVRNLETPSHVKMNSALLRTPDILTIQFDGAV